MELNYKAQLVKYIACQTVNVTKKEKGGRTKENGARSFLQLLWSQEGHNQGGDWAVTKVIDVHSFWENLPGRKRARQDLEINGGRCDWREEQELVLGISEIRRVSCETFHMNQWDQWNSGFCLDLICIFKGSFPWLS